MNYDLFYLFIIQKIIFETGFIPKNIRTRKAMCFSNNKQYPYVYCASFV